MNIVTKIVEAFVVMVGVLFMSLLMVTVVCRQLGYVQIGPNRTD